MSLSPVASVFTVSLLVSSILMPVVWLLLRRRNIVDVPNSRSLHVAPTPRGAGIAQLGGVLAGISAAGLPFAAYVGILGFSSLGASDDWRPMSARSRLSAQVLLSALTMAIMIAQPVQGMTATVALVGLVILPFTSNAMNFMDGIDGISALHGTVFGATFALLLWNAGSTTWPLLGVALVAASIAFVPWNWRPRAMMFLGDSGSYLLGSVVGLLIIAALLVEVPVEIAFAPIAIYVVDVMFTLARRAFRGEKVSAAHREHVYQRLVTAGWGHRLTATASGLASLGCGVSALSCQMGLIPAWAMVVVVLVIAFIYLLLPQWAARHGGRKGSAHA